MAVLTGKTALVTGGSRGIGRAAALALGKAGAQVVVHYGNAAKDAEAVVAQIRQSGGRADAVAADLAASDGPHKLARQVRGIVGDRLDILVANAGISRPSTIENTTVAEFDELFAVNVRAPFFVVQQLLPILAEGSSIVFVSSLGAHAAVGSLSAYSATKGAIDTIVKHFAAALGPRGIRLTPLLRASSQPTCRTSRKPPKAANTPWAFRRSSAWPSPMTSAESLPSWRRMMPAGSPATQSESTAAQNSEIKAVKFANLA
jgi:NAD(P)-dependent dehydrogenase (short-subunit alcohol dehydrogenase family)